MRPAVGTDLVRCEECGDYEYGGAPDCSRCRALVDGIVDDEWRRLLDNWQGESEHEIAHLVVAEPDRHDWRVIDAALDRIICGECGEHLSRGPMTCSPCNLAHGFRYAAVEIDRPGVPQGNEHAIRVNVSVVRRPQMTSAQELLVASPPRTTGCRTDWPARRTDQELDAARAANRELFANMNKRH